MIQMSSAIFGVLLPGPLHFVTTVVRVFKCFERNKVDFDAISYNRQQLLNSGGSD